MEVKLKRKTYQIERLTILEIIRQKAGLKVGLMTGLSINQLATQAGLFQQQLEYWYSVDDIFLSQLYKIAETQDYEIIMEFDFENKNPFDPYFHGEYKIANATITIEKEDDNSISPIKEIYSKYPIIFERQKKGRLKSLANLLVNTMMPVTRFCNIARISPQAFLVWIAEDDIKISRLYTIAKAHNAPIKWTLKKKQ